MIRLISMTEAEFDAFMVISMRDQAQGQVQAGNYLAPCIQAQSRSQGNV